MTIFTNRLTYGALDRPFVAASIIGAAGAGAMICTCYLTGTRGDNALASVVGVGLSWFTGTAIILVPIRAVILLKTLPYGGKQIEYVTRPEYPELHTLTYQATATLEPGMMPLPRNLAHETYPVFPAIDRHKLHKGFQLAMRYGMVSVRKMEDAGYTEAETRIFRDWLFDRGFATPHQGGAAKLNDAGKEYLDRYSPTTRAYRT